MKITTEQLDFHEVMAYYLYNTKSAGHGSAIREVIRPLRVYKKTENTIVALEIPVGALVHWNDRYSEYDFNNSSSNRKMRASAARVVQQIRFNTITSSHSNWRHDQRVKEYTLGNARDVTQSESQYLRSFKYNTGEVVIPANGFCMFRATCEAGVHFYVNLSDALDH